MKEVYETSVPSSYRQGGRETASGAQTGSVGKCAKPKRMSDSAPVADVSCSWLLLPQVSWFMRFIAVKYERCYCSSNIPTGCSFHPVWPCPCLLTNGAEPQLCNPTLPAFEKISSRSFLGLPLFSFSSIQLTIPLSTQDHGRKTESRQGFSSAPGLSTLFLICFLLPPPPLFFSHQSGVGNEERICILPPARVFLVQISCLWLE